ncbi:gtp binding domain [Fusarium flagelliforme]|uniref:Gtp binding domain n=1 Tax=Fusarium flagelliforme TaxID=2675880 RepID=A0A395MQL2_9HYPO|nr:gtp binding domain [Fusarium flagelliforme]
MLHSISSNRMSGPSRFNLTLLKAICGLPIPTNLAIVTTMWPEQPDLTRKRILNDREKELASEKVYFGELIAQGADMFRHYENGHRDSRLQTISAQRIISHLLSSSGNNTSHVLRLQREIVDERKALGQTAAGLAIAEKLQKALYENKKVMKTFESETTTPLSRKNNQYALQLQTLKSDTNKSIQKAEQEQQKLARTIEDLHEAEKQAIEQRISDLNQQFQTQLEAKEKEFQELQALYDEQVKQTMRHSKQIKGKKGERSKANVSNKSLKKAKDNVDKTRRDRERLREYTTQAVGGVMNGIAAGAVAGGMYSAP